MEKRIIWVISALIIWGCSSPEKPTAKQQQQFIKYITAFTAGKISKKNAIRVEFGSDVEGAFKNQKVEQAVFDFEPEIEGDAIWLNQRTIEFKPSEPLQSATDYTASLNMTHFFKNLPEDLKKFSFTFSTFQQAFTYEINALEPLKATELKWQRVKGSIKTADYANNQKVEQLFNAKQNDNNLKVSWNHYGLSNEHEFLIDSIERGEAASEVILYFDGTPLQVETKNNEYIKIPSLDDFSVFKVKTHSGNTKDDQYLEINFSDPIKANQRLAGLIYFKDGTKVTTSTSGNTVKVFPKTKFIGSKTLIIDKGIKNVLGFPLKSATKHQVQFINYKPAIEIIGEGNIIPKNDGAKLPFKAVNLSAVEVKILQIKANNVLQFFQVNNLAGNQELKRVGKVVYRATHQLAADGVDLKQWNTFALDLSKMIQQDPGAIYRVGISFKPSQSLYPCDSLKNDEQYWAQLPQKEDDYYQESQDWYYSGDFNYNGQHYNWSQRDNPCDITYYLSNNKNYHNVFASNLGITAKGNGNSKKYHVAIASLVTTEPATDVIVKFFDLQGEVIWEGKTDGEGFANTGELKRKPFLIEAKNTTDVGYLKLDDGNALSHSMFNVDGEKATEGIKGLLYGERGVWRPGDSVFLSFMLEDQLEVLPDNHPVVLEVFTPDNKMYKRIVKNSAINGLYNFIFKTDAEDVTGNWYCKAIVGGNTFHKSLRIENIKPNRLKITYDTQLKYLSNFNGQKLTLQSKWLHGASGSGLKADVEMSLSSNKTSFKNYKNYEFDDASKSFNSTEKKVFDGKLDQAGEAVINLNARANNNAPGMLNCKLKARVFEPGGDFSVDVNHIPFAPFAGFIGFKLPEGEGWRNALYSDQPNLIDIVALTPDGKLAGDGEATIEVYEIDWHWWWDHASYQNLGSYIKRSSTNKIHSATVELVNGKARYELKFDKHTWGRKFIKITHPSSGHSSGTTFFTTYSGWWSQKNNAASGAEMLDFSTDKKSYKIGEEVFVKLPNTKSGKILVSLEKNSQVLATYWHDLKDGSNITIPVKKGMAPNFYVNLALIQPHDSTKNDAPIRMYGAQSIDVVDESTVLQPQISMPNELTPEKEVTIKVSEKSGKDMTYTLAIVDEGLLDLTRFQTPNPHQHFYAKEALQVLTWDVYDDVLGAFAGKISGLLAIGGGDLIVGEGKKELKRFEPMVRYFKPQFLAGGDENEISFTMPNYVGSVRVMLIAGHKGAYGSVEKTAAVTKPLMVFPTLPRVLRPNETADVPVTLFVMDPTIRSVTISAEASNGATIFGDASKTINITEVGEQTVFFKVKAGDALGKASFKVNAKSGAEKTHYEVGLPITPSSPMVFNNQTEQVINSKSFIWRAQNNYLTGNANFAVELSAIPNLGLKSKLNYLIGYPHGCIEQTTSKLFGQLYLPKIIELSNEQQQEIQSNISAGIKKLQRMQQHGGSFGYWQNSSNYHEWGSTYAGHFLLKAKKEGYAVPEFMLNKWERFQKQMANNWQQRTYNSDYTYSYDAQQINQAYRLFALAQTDEPAIGAMNRFKNETINETATWYLAGAYAYIGQTAIALELIKNVQVDVPPKWNGRTFSSGISLMALKLEVGSVLEQWKKSALLLQALSDEANKYQWFSTRKIGAIARGAGIYIETSNTSNEINAEILVNNKVVAEVDKKVAVKVIELGELADSTKVEVRNNGGTFFATLQSQGYPLQGEEIAEDNSVNLRVNYYHNNRPITRSNIKKGMDIVAEAVVTSSGDLAYYDYMVLNYIFPSAWEMRNIRMEDTTDDTEYENMDIKDDRVYVYFNVKRGHTKTFKFQFNVTYGGSYYLPAISCEHMYKKQINSVVPGEWAEFK